MLVNCLFHGSFHFCINVFKTAFIASCFRTFSWSICFHFFFDWRKFLQ